MCFSLILIREYTNLEASSVAIDYPKSLAQPARRGTKGDSSGVTHPDSLAHQSTYLPTIIYIYLAPA